MPTHDTHLSLSQAFEQAENAGINPSDNATFGEIVDARFSRRGLMRGALGITAIAAFAEPLALEAAAQGNPTPNFPFRELSSIPDDKHAVADGHKADVLIRWGDPLFADAPAFDPEKQSAAAQARQFGYNNDYLGFIPMPGAAKPGDHGLLCVNHEYTNRELMFPGLPQAETRSAANALARAGFPPELTAVEMMAHGGSVVEVKKTDGQWKVVQGRYNRRITAETPMDITGPASGHPRLQTNVDPSGKAVKGMLNNCAGGRTPWRTWVTCEENINGYFSGKLADGHREATNYRRMGVPSGWYGWGMHHERFDVAKEPNEANRFGWVVEIDPFDPASTPKKRTALGRFKHEGAAGITSKSGHYVIYMGDDERFEYVYRFVTADKVSGDPAKDRDLLDKGTLAVARFNVDGSLDWLPLAFGEGPLTAANGFASQADVLIEARRAGDLLGATKMDRPEDVEANPKTNKVYVALTNNNRRRADQVNAANPRADNRFGHLVEMTPPDGDHTANRYSWEILVKCGDPSITRVGATFHPNTTKDGWFAMPDNVAIDGLGRLWVATDSNSPAKTGRNDGLWAMETDGAARGTSKLFFRVPNGAEMCGPEFTPDDEALFLAVQHPGEADSEDPSAKPASYEEPSTRWPDFLPQMPPRPSVVVVTKTGGGKVGT